MAGKTWLRDWLDHRGAQTVATVLTVLLVLSVVTGVWSVVTLFPPSKGEEFKDYPRWLVWVVVAAFLLTMVLDYLLKAKDDRRRWISDRVRLLYSGAGATWAFIGALVLGVTSPPPFGDWLKSVAPGWDWWIVLGASTFVVGFGTWFTLDEGPPRPRKFQKTRALNAFRAYAARKRSVINSLRTDISILECEKAISERKANAADYTAKQYRSKNAELSRRNADLERQVADLKRARVDTLS